MIRIKYDIGVEDVRKMHVDALMGKSIFEYKTRVSDIRVLQSAFVLLAGILAELTDHRGILILDDIRISKARLKDEWESISKLIQPFIISRLQMVVFSDGSVIEVYGDLSDEEFEALPEIQVKLREKQGSKRFRKQVAFFEILSVLLIHWFRGYGPLQLNQLSQLSGFSYPTVALSLEKIEPQLIRHSDRSVELRSFPRDHWLKLIAARDDLRLPQGYWAQRPRDVDNLIERLMERTDKDFAFGGIIGARHYLPGIDLVGIPRLDLSVKNWSVSIIDRFIRNLDPGLKKAEQGEIPQVVVHNLFRPESLFTKGNSLPVADEVECLLDLHEARLESQALELLEHFKEQARR